MKHRRIILYLLGFCCVTALSGCAFGKFGKAEGHYLEIQQPAVIIGKDKGEVIVSLGIPDSVVTYKNTEYWGYKNKAGWFIIFGGKTEERDLVLEFKGGEKVTNSYFVNQGFSLGILTGQGVVSN